MQASISITYTTTAPGPFTLAHNLDLTPVTVVFEFESGGTVWFQTPRYDATNLYLVASAAGVTFTVIIYATCGGC
jgi:hypothetical protein